MIRVNLKEAGDRLADLAEEAAHGEDVVITRPDGTSWKLVLLPPPQPVPRFGSARGLIKLAEDFDAPLPDFEDYSR